MTFVPFHQPLNKAGGAHSHLDRFRRIAVAAERNRVGDEDGARRALGNDPHMPRALMAGASMEHLARIALG